MLIEMGAYSPQMQNRRKSMSPLKLSGARANSRSQTPNHSNSNSPSKHGEFPPTGDKHVLLSPAPTKFLSPSMGDQETEAMKEELKKHMLKTIAESEDVQKPKKEEKKDKEPSEDSSDSLDDVIKPEDLKKPYSYCKIIRKCTALVMENDTILV